MSSTGKTILATVALGLLAMLCANAAEAAFVGEDIGSTWGGSTTGTLPGPVTIVADGGDIWGNNDAFHYYHDTWTGDFNGVVRMVSQTNPNSWAKSGIMLRESTAANSRHAHISATPGNGITLQWRDSTGGGSGWPNTRIPGSPNSGSAPFWLSLKREGNTFTARWAPDVAGQPGWWSASQSHTNNNMPATVEHGLSVTSHTTGNTCTTVFDNAQFGNWEARGELSVNGGAVRGKAYGWDQNAGAVLGPAHWKIEEMVTNTYSGPGLANEWFPNQSHTPPTIVPIFTTDRIDWTNGNYPPETGWSGNHNNFSVRYTGQFYADHDGNYSFEEHVDDEAWLVIDGSQVLHNNQWNNDTSVTVPFTTGWHDIEFRTREGGGGDFGRLRWDPAGGTSWQVMTTANANFQTSYSYTTTNLLAEGWGNVGDAFNLGTFTTLPTGLYTLQLTVDYQGETFVTLGTFLIPEPSTLLIWSLLAGLGVGLGWYRRRR